jgi:hypothetical protein
MAAKRNFINLPSSLAFEKKLSFAPGNSNYHAFPPEYFFARSRIHRNLGGRIPVTFSLQTHE